MASVWHFVLPADHDQPSGGNRYNERLMQALMRTGQPVVATNFEAYQTARRADREGCYFVDSLFVGALATLTEPHSKQLRTVFVLHHLDSIDTPPGHERVMKQAEEKTAFAHVDAFLVTSSFSESYLQALGVRKPVIVLEPGMDTIGLRQKPHANETSVLMVANLIARKGIFPWLQTLTNVLKPTDAFTLAIVGRTDLEPVYAEACQRYVEEQPLLRSRVRFAGAMPYEEVEQYYLRARLFVSAARMETFGMALQEAKAYRIPLLTLVGGYAERHITASHSGYVFTTLAEMAKFFLNLVRDPARLESWQTDITTQPSSAIHSWDSAARRLIKQMTDS